MRSSVWRGVLAALVVAFGLAVVVTVRPWRSDSGEATRRQVGPEGGQPSSTGRDGEVAAPEQPVGAGVVLGENGGLGLAPVGMPMDTAIPAITSVLGPPDYAGNWAEAYCDTGEGAGGALLVWGNLGVLFTDGGVRIDGRVEHQGQRVLWGYQYGGTITDRSTSREIIVARQVDPGLTTTTGIGLGSTGGQIEKAYGPRAEAMPGEEDSFPGPRYLVRREPGGPDDGLSLLMDANGPEGKVSVMLAGGNCGE